MDVETLKALTNDSQTNSLNAKRRPLVLIFSCIFLLLSVVFLLFFWQFLNTPPANFPLNEKFVIDPGSGLKQIANQAKTAGLVRSKYRLLAELILDDKQKTVKAGTYIFTEPLTTSALALTLFNGNPNDNLVRLTHIEGESIKDLARSASEILPNFSSEEFLSLNSQNEGLLFPDTYFVSKDFNAVQLTELLLTTFDEKTQTLQEQAIGHFLTWDEIIILASILEREANSPDSKKMVSGILQNRLKLGMALQADATIEYTLSKPLASLTPEDLKIDSPYNTYLYPGLPPTPIGNPGLEAILAVIHPTNSDYYFYITGQDGNFYYAKDFDQHRVNIARYLR